jgi:hypothetical protein
MELAIGTINGANVAFATSIDYVPGTVRAFTPTLQHPSDLTELGGKDFELAEAPLADDLVYVVYRSIE